MLAKSFYTRWLLGGLLSIGLVTTANAACNRGDLDTQFCDENGDLVADTPKDASK